MNANVNARKTVQHKTVALVACAIITAGGAILAGWSHRATGRAQAAASAAEQERRRLVADFARLEGAIAEAKRNQGGLRTVLNQTDSLRVAERPGISPPLEIRVPFDNAEMQVRALKVLRSGLGLKYGAFYRALGLDADRIATFEAQLAEYEGTKSDIGIVERAMPLDRATAVPFDAVTIDGQRIQIAMDPSIAKLRREADAQLKQSQTALLGAEGYAQLQEFEAATESRGFVGDLVGNLALTAHPLTAEQGKGLMQALRAGNFSARIEPEKTDWSTILAQARPLLAPAQFDELQALAAAHKLKVMGNEISRALRGARN